MNEEKNDSDGKPDKSSSFALKDRLALFFSIAALFFTGLNFWWNNLRVVNRMEARVTDVRTTWQRGRSQLLDTVIIKVVLVNSGNRPGVLLSPWYQMADTNSTVNGAWGAMVGNSGEFPIIVQPHDFKLVDVRIAVVDILRNPGRIVRDEHRPGMGNFTYYCALQYFAVDSKGRRADMVGREFQTLIGIRVPIDGNGALLTATDGLDDNSDPRILNDSLIDVSVNLSDEVNTHPSTVIYDY